jgi:hypothetical protein
MIVVSAVALAVWVALILKSAYVATGLVRAH